VRDAVAQAPCIILNADDVSGPASSPPCLFNERAAPLSRGEQVASARKFVARVASELPSALLSLGWTTRGEGGRYAEEDVDAMDAVVGAAAAAGLPVTLAVRASWLSSSSWTSLERRLARCPPSSCDQSSHLSPVEEKHLRETLPAGRACFDLLAAGAEERDHDGGAARRAPSLAPAIAAAALGAAVASVAAVAVLSLAKWRSTRT